MANVIPLSELEDYSADELQKLVDKTPKTSSLREAVRHFIRAIHGLPQVMDCDLRQVRVYIGRAGATSVHLRQRWSTRHEEFEQAPSTLAMVVVRSSTDRIRDNAWETTAQRLVKALVNNGALCCANALLGTSGRFPETEETAL